MDFSELLYMDLSKLIQDEKFIVLHVNCCIAFAQTRQCEQWLIRKGRQLHTCPKKEKKWHLSTGYEDKKHWFIWFCNNLIWIEKKPHKQFQRTLPFGISQSNSKSMYHITRVFVRQNRYMLNQQTS